MEASPQKGGAYGFSGGETDTSTGLTRNLGGAAAVPPPESAQEAHQDQGKLHSCLYQASSNPPFFSFNFE